MNPEKEECAVCQVTGNLYPMASMKTVEQNGIKLVVSQGYADNFNDKFVLFGSQEKPVLVSIKKHKKTPSDCFWVASLSNGMTIFEDKLDTYETAIYANSWFRLQQFCEQKKAAITRIRFQMNGITYNLPNDCDGYILLKRHLAVFPNRTASSDTHKGIGAVKDGKIYVLWLGLKDKVADIEIRNSKGNESFIIWNPQT